MSELQPRNYSQELGIDGKQIAALMQLGFACFQQNRLKEARDIFEGVLVLVPLEPYSYSMLGSIHQQENRFDEALNCYNVSLHLYPASINTLTNRGEVLLKLGRLEEAASDLKAAIEMDPDYEDPAANRARFLATLTLEGLKLAEEKGTQAVQEAADRLNQQLQV
jgi:tetratricopeptide (TPR) repeat protein